MSRSGIEVAFDTAGSRGTGVGHVVRSLALTSQVRQLGARVTVLDARAVAAVTDRRFSRPRRPDVLVIDRPDTTDRLLRRRHRQWPSARIVALDYYADAVEGLVTVINLNDARERRGVTRPHGYHRGLEYATLRPAFREQRGRRRAVPSQVRRILVGFGGTDPFGWNQAAIEALSTVLPSRVSMEVLRGVADPAALMASCDLAIIGGGTMMIEAACLGVPAVVVPRTVEERVFARQFAHAGAVRVVAAVKEFPAGAVRRQVASLLTDREARQHMRDAGRALVDGRGIERVARLIVSAGAPRA